MGGVFIGIGISLLMEAARHPSDYFVGLGFGGAIVINLSGGLVLFGWLVFGNLSLPHKGRFLLWIIAITLIGISCLELCSYLTQKKESEA